MFEKKELFENFKKYLLNDYNKKFQNDMLSYEYGKYYQESKHQGERYQLSYRESFIKGVKVKDCELKAIKELHPNVHEAKYCDNISVTDTIHFYVNTITPDRKNANLEHIEYRIISLDNKKFEKLVLKYKIKTL